MAREKKVTAGALTSEGSSLVRRETWPVLECLDAEDMDAEDMVDEGEREGKVVVKLLGWPS